MRVTKLIMGKENGWKREGEGSEGISAKGKGEGKSKKKESLRKGRG